MNQLVYASTLRLAPESWAVWDQIGNKCAEVKDPRVAKALASVTNIYLALLAVKQHGNLEGELLEIVDKALKVAEEEA